MKFLYSWQKSPLVSTDLGTQHNSYVAIIVLFIKSIVVLLCGVGVHNDVPKHHNGGRQQFGC